MAASISQSRTSRKTVRFGLGFRLGIGLGFGAALLFAGSMSGCDGATREARAASAYEEDATPESLSDFTLRWLFGVGMGHKLHLGAMQLYYVDPITEQQARATGSFLSHLGIGQRETLVQLRPIGHGQKGGPKGEPNSASNSALASDGNSPGYELRIGTPYSRKEHIDRETRNVYQFMALSAEGVLFDGAPVQVSICNSLLQPLLILRPKLK